MICENCGSKFPKLNNIAIRINGEKITVCPDCGHEEAVIKKKKDQMK